MSDQSEAELKTQNLAARLLALADEERRRVARELHDDISQRLALLADDADRLRREINHSDQANHLHRLDNLVDQARSLSDDLRKISHTLHPAILEDLGLAVALRSLTRDFAERHGMLVTFTANDIPSNIPLALATTFYRIAQEALRNVLKHAGGTCVRVALDGFNDQLSLVVSDLGVGFDALQTYGLGLTSMRERAHLAGGSFSVDSAPGNGTTVRVQIPFAVRKTN